MIEHVWLIADATTGDVSYVHHGHEHDEAHWKTVGPFAYTTKAAAQAAALNPRFLPHGIRGTFKAMEVEASGFVQAIYNGFPPINTDVFLLDDRIFPLTSGGAEWVDDAIGTPLWVPMFDEDGGLSWLDRVLEQVAGHLDMKMETVQAIGNLNAAAEDEDAAVEQTALLIQQHVRVAITPEPGTVVIAEDEQHHILPPSAVFWLRTTGMVMFGLPELAIRNVPGWWVTAAGAELNGWAGYALDRGIASGDELDGGGPIPLKLLASESPDPFWAEKGIECLRLEVGVIVLAAGHQRHNPDGPKMVH